MQLIISNSLQNSHDLQCNCNVFQNERGKWTTLKHSFLNNFFNQVFQFYFNYLLPRFLIKVKVQLNISHCQKIFFSIFLTENVFFLPDFKQTLKSQENSWHLTFILQKALLWGLSKMLLGSYMSCKRICHGKNLWVSENVPTLICYSNDPLLKLQTKQNHSVCYCICWQLYHHEWTA